MPLVLLLGDFLQLPPVPEKNSLLAEGTKAYEYEHRIAKCMVQQSDVVFFFKTSMRFSDPNLRHILDAMRTPGGKPIEDAAWQALEATQVNTCENGNPDAKLLAALDFKEGAYEWQTVSLTQQVVARLQAAQSKRILYYIPAVDVPEVQCSKQLYRKMSAECNLTSAQKLMSILPIFLGMRVRLMKSLTPQLGPESEGEVVGIEFHPNEPSIIGKHGVRPSVSSSGFALLHLLPLCVYVKFDNCLDFLSRQSPVNSTKSVGQMQVARLASFLLVFLQFALKNASGSFMLSRLQSIRSHSLSMCHDGKCP